MSGAGGRHLGRLGLGNGHGRFPSAGELRQGGHWPGEGKKRGHSKWRERCEEDTEEMVQSGIVNQLSMTRL